MNKKIYKLIIIFSASILSLLSFIFLFFPLSYGESVYESVFRLHIIANSDTKDDQAVKLLVRDALLEYEKNAMENASSLEEARSILMASGNEILNLTENVLKENGMDYGAQLMVGNFYFPDREYGEEFYPAGNYEALRIVLGDGAGKNWWCVMFPPLCILETNDGKIEQEEVEFSSLLLDFLKRIDGGSIWNSIKESFALRLH